MNQLSNALWSRASARRHPGRAVQGEVPTDRRPESLVLPLAALLAAVVLVGCGSSSASTQKPASTNHMQTPQVVKLVDNGIEAPAVVRGPAIDLQVINDGTLVHALEITQVRPGTTTEQFVDAVHRHDTASVTVSDTGGVTALGPGERLRYRRDLPAGSYVFFSSLPTAGGSDQLAKGMIKLFAVSGSQAANAPRPESTVELGDDAVTASPIASGTHRIAIVNRGTRPHEVWVTGVPSDQDQRRLGEIDTWFENGQVGPTPLGAHFPGGHQSIPPGASVMLAMTFRSGYTYHLVDNTGATPISTVVAVS
jgi:hypothetical protein